MGLECEHCGKTFADDDENVVDIYLQHQDVHHKDKISSEEELFENFSKKLIKQKEMYLKSKEETGDSDLVFNAKERDARNSV